MPLKSELFRNDPRLEACAVNNQAHITLGAIGEHVSKIQTALLRINQAFIEHAELSAQHYGASTAAAVLKYKRERSIINRSYQTQADNIVGIMTITYLDNELVEWERRGGGLVTIKDIFCGLVRS